MVDITVSLTISLAVKHIAVCSLCKCIGYSILSSDLVNGLLSINHNKQSQQATTTSNHNKQSQQAITTSNHNKQSQQAITTSNHNKQSQQAITTSNHNKQSQQAITTSNHNKQSQQAITTSNHNKQSQQAITTSNHNKQSQQAITTSNHNKQSQQAITTSNHNKQSQQAITTSNHNKQSQQAITTSNHNKQSQQAITTSNHNKQSQQAITTSNHNKQSQQAITTSNHNKQSQQAITTSNHNKQSQQAITTSNYNKQSQMTREKPSKDICCCTCNDQAARCKGCVCARSKRSCNNCRASNCQSKSAVIADVLGGTNLTGPSRTSESPTHLSRVKAVGLFTNNHVPCLNVCAEDSIKAMYLQVIKWRPNLFRLPRCNESRKFLNELASLFELATTDDDNGSMLMRATILCQSCLQKIDGRLIQSCAARTRGAAGPSGVDASGWQVFLSGFDRDSFRLATALASLSKRLACVQVQRGTTSALVASRILSLPLRFGGLGIADPCVNSVKEWQYSAIMCQALDSSEDSYSLAICLQNASEKIRRMRQIDLKEVFQAISEECDPDRKIALEHATVKGASSWLNILPSEYYDFRLSNREFCDGIATRYSTALLQAPEKFYGYYRHWHSRISFVEYRSSNIVCRISFVEYFD
ncbi:hypothetical protein GJ496_007070 [Pomphorhynchus laevis]|nr:hypothetical protein GJ496_007070 [Pomphorhynchus laevis]